MSYCHKKTVCEFWLRRQCTKGDNCGFLHDWDPTRMPICRNFKVYNFCNEQGCNFKHGFEKQKECNLYNLGFCLYGKSCSFKHTKQLVPSTDLFKIETIESFIFGRENTGSHKLMNKVRTGSFSDLQTKRNKWDFTLKCINLCTKENYFVCFFCMTDIDLCHLSTPKIKRGINILKSVH
jgi:hypothetical protein